VDVRTEPLPWAEIVPASLSLLAVRAFAEEGAESRLLRMAFAYAHDLEDAFWDAELELGTLPDRAPLAAMQKVYVDRYNAKQR
jgi:hypothetical protein